MDSEKAVTECRDAYQRVGFSTPYSFQETSWKHIFYGKNTLISAGTGSGKTETALLPGLACGKRIIVLYPTKALLQDQVGRVKQLAEGKTIAVDTGDEDDRFFYCADVILTSLDKFLYRLFGYGKKRWSYLYPYRIGFAGERKTILILDEAHAYEDVAFSHFWFLLKKLTYERWVQTILLSATLPPKLIEVLKDSDRKYFPREGDEGGFFEIVEDQEPRSGRLVYGGTLPHSNIVDKALECFDQKKRVIIVLRRVVRSREDKQSDGRTLHEVWEALIQKVKNRDSGKLPKAIIAAAGEKGVVGNILTYHGHQMPQYRKMVLERLKALDDGWKPYDDSNSKKGEPFILVTTSAMEVGVDISSDVMITDLCQPDSFIQRIGRCARRPSESGKALLIAPLEKSKFQSEKQLWGFLKDRPAGSNLDAQAKQKLNDLNTCPDFERIHLRLEYLQDQSLYRYIYDFVQENRELWEKGVLITRDWQPSVALVRSEKRDGQDYIGGIPSHDFWRGKEIKEKMLLPVSGAADLAPYCAWVFEGYNEGNQHVQRVAIGGSKERTLQEVLRFAGFESRMQKDVPNKVKPIYALGLPLILLLGLTQDPNIGLSYHSQYAKAEELKNFGVFSPSPLLRAQGVILRKDKKSGKRESWEYELPLYWFEPQEEQAE